MSQNQSQFYSLEKTAEVLGLSTGDVNRLRERDGLHGFRDGANWKFRREDVEKHLTQQIRSRSKGNNPAPGEATDDNDIFTLPEEGMGKRGSSVNLGDAVNSGSSGFLNLHDESGLSLLDDDDLILNISGKSSGISLLDEVGGGESDNSGGIVLGKGRPTADNKVSLAKESSLSLSEDGSGFLLDDGQAGSSAATPSPSSDDVFQLAPEVEDDGGIFALVEEPVAPKAAPVSISKRPVSNDETMVMSTDMDDLLELGEAEDFQLAPVAKPADESDSGSASQVIAIDDDNLFLSDADGGADDHFGAGPAGTPTSSFGAAASPFDNDGFGDGPIDFTKTGGDDTFGSVGKPIFEETPKPVVLPPKGEGCTYNAGKGCARETEYNGLQVLLFMVPSLLLLVTGSIAVYELIRNIWSWDQPFTLSGTILETIGKLVNLIN